MFATRTFDSKKIDRPYGYHGVLIALPASLVMWAAIISVFVL